jgi:hypothetical protein
MRFRLNFFRFVSLVLLAWGLNELRLRPEEYVTQGLVILAALYLFGSLSSIVKLRAQANALLKEAHAAMDRVNAEQEKVLERARSYEIAMQRVAEIEDELNREREAFEKQKRKEHSRIPARSENEQANSLH